MMKTFKEILSEVNSVRALADKSKEIQKRLESEWLKELDFMKRHEVRVSLESKWCKECETEHDLQITIKILQNNARIALFNEVMPVFLEILAKYKGKPYGEKTREKIAQELYDKTGASGYIYQEYAGQKVSIYPRSVPNEYNITVGVRGDKELLVGNKIQLVPLDSFEPWYIKKEYFDDIPSIIAEMKQHYAKAVLLQRELYEVCSKFNRYAVEGINSIYGDRRIFENFASV